MDTGSRVAVWGHFASGNLGDELVVEVMANALRRRRPRQPVVAISSSVADTTRRHAVSTYPLNPGAERSPSSTGGIDHGDEVHASLRNALRRLLVVRVAWKLWSTTRRIVREVPFLIRSYRRLQDLDVLIVSGSGQLLDAWKGPWWHPYTTFRWALLARLTRTHVVYPSVGAGPIDHALSQFMIRKSIDWAEYVTVRDPHTATLLRAIGVDRDLPVRPDMGWGWESPVRATEPPGDRGSAVIGVNPMAHEDPRNWPSGDPRRYDAYLTKLTAFVTALLERGRHVVIFSSHPRSDSRVSADIDRLLHERGLAQHPGLSRAFDGVDDAKSLVQVIAGFDYVVAGRFHSVLLPLAMGIPTLGLAYHPKTTELLAAVGRPDRCMNIDDFQVQELLAELERTIEADTAEGRRSLQDRAAELRAETEFEFDELFGRVETVPASLV